MPKGRQARITELGELQLQALDRLSQLGEGTVYDVLDQFPPKQRPRYTTMLTVLRSLEKRGLVEHRTAARTYVFRPTVESRRVRGQMLMDVLGRAFSGSPRSMVATLLDTEAVTPEVLDELKGLIAEREARGDDDEP